jgi:hypothetical protein
MVMDWDSVTVELPKSKTDLHILVDRDVLDFFRKTGKGYQTRINAVLRSYDACGTTDVISSARQNHAVSKGRRG